MFKKTISSVWLYLIASSLVLLWVAIYNGYPIVYSDTSTYLSSGFEFETPADRPITYGLFIYLTSLGGKSLWLTVFIQSLIISYVIYLLFKYFTNYKNPVWYAFISLVVIAVFSSLPWISGMLLADIFTPVTVFSLLLLVVADGINKTDKYILYFIFFLSNAMHMSHLLINLLILCTILFCSYFKLSKRIFVFVSRKQLYVLIAVTFSAIIIMSSAMSKSKHIFYMGRMVENGILKKYLDENCETKNYKICAYKDSLPPNADRFLWDFENSPVYKLGGWKTTKDEFNEIIEATFSEPKYLKLHVFYALQNTLIQLATFNLGEGNIAFPNGTKLHERIGLFTNDIQQYEKSKQTRGEFSLFKDFNSIQVGIVYLSLLITLVLITLFRKHFSNRLIVLVVFTLLGIMYNDLVCASLSTVANRFAVRVIWMIPFVLILLVMNKRSLVKSN